MQVIDPTVQYYISAASRPSTFITADTANNLILTNPGSALGALSFIITTSSHNAARRNICTNYQSSRYCLDQWGNNATQAILQSPGYYSGQEWSLTGSQQSDGTTAWRMQSDFAGPTRYLAVDGNNVFMVADASESATYWRIINTTSSQTTMSSITTSTTPSTRTVSATTSTEGLNQPSTATNPTSTATTIMEGKSESRSSSLSTGATVGIALGAVAVVLLAAFIVMFWVLWQRKARQQQRSNHSVLPPVYQPGQPALSGHFKKDTRSQVFEVPAYPQARAMSIHEIGDPRSMPELECSRRL